MPEGSKGGKVIVRLLDNEGKEVAKSSVRVAAGKWKKQLAVLTAQTDVDAAVLSVERENYIWIWFPCSLKRLSRGVKTD